MAGERLDNRAGRAFKDGFPRTQAVRISGLRPHHVGRNFVALGVLLGYGYSTERGWGVRVNATSGPQSYFEGYDGDMILRYYLDDEEA